MKKQEELEFIRLLKKVSSPISTELFNAIAGRLPQIAIEVIILKATKKGYEVLLTRRPSKDNCWNNLWHSPGTILRNKESLEKALKRLTVKELKFSFEKKPKFVNWRNSIDNKRGHEASIIYRYVVNSDFDPPQGKFFLVENLPKDIVSHHPSIIQIGIKG